ncbi:putative neural-cadherin isoform X3 [Penaeus vannamei]|uniref:Putative neural-cadherin isoform X3 n=1 Tax=Penaeus vannamei TaxID=6689 RepID=A0A423SJU2_PENVA|nr:putative neural-cadherin isoform X3 [Penaeus vannamei]
MNLRISFEDPLSPAMQGGEAEGMGGSPDMPRDPSSLASKALPLQVVDTNSTSLVTPPHPRPRLPPARPRRRRGLHGALLPQRRPLRQDGQGEQVRVPRGRLGAALQGGGAQLPRLRVGVGAAAAALPAQHALAAAAHPAARALVLYSGPLSATSARPRFPPTPMMALQLVDGRPQLLMEGARGRVRLQVNASVSTGTWHTLHVHLNGQVRAPRRLPDGRLLRAGLDQRPHPQRRPLHSAGGVGGESRHRGVGRSGSSAGGRPGTPPTPRPSDYGWSEAPVKEDLEGCVSHLRVNDQTHVASKNTTDDSFLLPRVPSCLGLLLLQLINLGEPAYSSGSERGCTPQAAVCREKVGDCGFRGRCVGGLDHPECQCDPGWAGPGCSTPTEPISFGRDSYMKVATPVTLDPYAVTAQLRVRARAGRTVCS